MHSELVSLVFLNLTLPVLSTPIVFCQLHKHILTASKRTKCFVVPAEESPLSLLLWAWQEAMVL